MLQIAFDYFVIHNAWGGYNFDTGVWALDMDLRQRVRGARLEISAEALVSPGGPFSLDYDIDGLLDGYVTSCCRGSGTLFEERFAIGLGILSDVLERGLGLFESDSCCSDVENDWWEIRRFCLGERTGSLERFLAFA